jgi:predicted ABC-type ATPase
MQRAPTSAADLPVPRMIVIAGPPGSGKSSRFPLSSFGIDSFNADERAAELNFGSFHKIPQEIRAQVNDAFEGWVLGHITAQRDFAFETTLGVRSRFSRRGWLVSGASGRRWNISAGSVNESVRRIMERSYRGGHSASGRLVAQIYEKSTRNLLSALEFPQSGIEVVRIYDNSTSGGMVRQVLALRKGRIQSAAANLPAWTSDLLKGTKFETM